VWVAGALLLSVLVRATDEQGQAFLDNNKNQPGVVTLASGLQYKVLASGAAGAPKPTTSSRVSVHYAGRLVNGKEFDSSLKRGEPAVFGVAQVISGWTEALLLMKKGDKWEVYLPSQLAYGSRGAGGVIPPDAALIFTIELLDVIGGHKTEL